MGVDPSAKTSTVPKIKFEELGVPATQLDSTGKPSETTN